VSGHRLDLTMTNTQKLSKESIIAAGRIKVTHYWVARMP